MQGGRPKPGKLVHLGAAGGSYHRDLRCGLAPLRILKPKWNCRVGATNVSIRGRRQLECRAGAENHGKSSRTASGVREDAGGPPETRHLKLFFSAPDIASYLGLWATDRADLGVKMLHLTRATL